jgi:hypothetical protein
MNARMKCSSISGKCLMKICEFGEDHGFTVVFFNNNLSQNRIFCYENKPSRTPNGNKPTRRRYLIQLSVFREQGDGNKN